MRVTRAAPCRPAAWNAGGEGRNKNNQKMEAQKLLHLFSLILAHPFVIAVVIAGLTYSLGPKLTIGWEVRRLAHQIKTDLAIELLSTIGEYTSSFVESSRKGVSKSADAKPKEDDFLFGKWFTDGYNIKAKLAVHFNNPLVEQNWQEIFNLGNNIIGLIKVEEENREVVARSIIKDYPFLQEEWEAMTQPKHSDQGMFLAKLNVLLLQKTQVLATQLLNEQLRIEKKS